MVKLIKAFAVSLIALGCSGGDGFSEEFAEDDMSKWDLTDQPMRAKPRKAVPLVAVVEPSRGPWSGSSALGQSQSYLRTSNNRQTILKMGENGPPRVRTVSLFLDYDRYLASNSGVNFNAIADVICGVGGTTHQFEVDWDNGMVFSAPCNSIEITAVYGAPFAGAMNPPVDLRVSAMIGVGRSWSTPPTRTYPCRFTPNGDYALWAAPVGGTANYIAIPPFAKLVKILPNQMVAPNYEAAFNVGNRVEFYASPAVPGALGEYLGNKPAFMDGIAIPHGARILRFYNGSGNSLSVAASFVLAL